MADERARTTVLPLPARVFHRRVWEPRDDTSPHLS